jgi:predicted transcriptional regulator
VVEAVLADAEAGKLIPPERVAEELRRKRVTGAA